MAFDEYAAAHFAVVSDQSLNKIHFACGLVILQEAMNHCYKVVPGRFLRPGGLLDVFLAFYDICCPPKTPSLTFVTGRLRGEDM